MARKTVEQLLVQIDATTEGLRRELRRADKAVENSNRKVGRSLTSMDRKFGSLERTVTRFGGAMVAAYAVKELILFSDRFGILEDRIKSATRATGDYKRVSESLKRTAILTGTALSTNVDLFQRLAFSVKTLGASNKKILRLNEIVQKLGVISGSTNAQMQNGTLQLSQGLGEGVFRAQEFNSVQENTPAILDAIAKGLGRNTSELRRMVKAGKLLSKDVFEALLSQAEDVEKQFEEMPNRIARSWEALTTAIGGKAANSRGSGLLADSFQGVANFLGPDSDQDKIKQAQKDIAALTLTIKEYGFALELLPEGTLFNNVAARLGKAKDAKEILEDEIEILRERNKLLKEIPETRKPFDTNAILKRVKEEDADEDRFAAFDALRDNADKIKEMMMDLELEVARSAGQRRKVVQMEAEREIQIWKEMLDKKMVTEQQFSEARRMIAEKTANAIKKITEKELEDLNKEAKAFGDAMAASFESRGITALLDGDIGGAVKGLARDFAEMILRLAILKPLAESIFGGLQGGDGGSSLIGSVLGSIFGGGRAGGGPVRGGMVYRVGEKGPEDLLIPANGTIVPNQALQRGVNDNSRSGQQVTVHQTINISADVKNDVVAEKMAGLAPAMAQVVKQQVLQQLSGVTV